MKAFFALFLAAFILSSFNLLIRQQSLMYGDQAQVVARLGLAFLMLLLFLLYRKSSFHIPKIKIVNVICLALSSALMIALITIAINQGKIANAIFVTYAGTLTTSFFIGTFYFKEKVTKQKFFTLFLVVSGIAILLQEVAMLSVAVLTALASGFFGGLRNAIRKTLGEVDSNTLLFYQLGIGTIFMIAMLYVHSGDVFREVSIQGALVTALFAVLVIIVGRLLLYGFQNADLFISTVIVTSEILITIVLAYAFYSEMPEKYELIGGMLIFLAGVVGAAPKNILEKLPFSLDKRFQ